MLVLTIREGGTFTIGEGPDAVSVTIYDIKGGRTRVAIAAPKSVRILRNELIEKPQPTTQEIVK